MSDGDVLFARQTMKSRLSKTKLELQKLQLRMSQVKQEITADEREDELKELETEIRKKSAKVKLEIERIKVLEKFINIQAKQKTVLADDARNNTRNEEPFLLDELVQQHIESSPSPSNWTSNLFWIGLISVGFYGIYRYWPYQKSSASHV